MPELRRDAPDEGAIRPGVLACAPVPELDIPGSSWVTRRVHLVHEQLVAVDRVVAGAGVYVLSERGRARAVGACMTVRWLCVLGRGRQQP